MAPATFEDLHEEFSKLNQETDEDLNEIILRSNEQLDQLKAGIEVWLTDAPVETDEWKDKLDANDEATGEETCKATVLGYCRVGGGWVLAVKNCSLIKDQPNVPFSFCKVRGSSSPTSLLRASRNVRIKSLELIPDICDRLQSEAQKMRKAIEDAKARFGKKLAASK